MAVPVTMEMMMDFRAVVYDGIFDTRSSDDPALGEFRVRFSFCRDNCSVRGIHGHFQPQSGGVYAVVYDADGADVFAFPLWRGGLINPGETLSVYAGTTTPAPE